MTIRIKTSSVSKRLKSKSPHRPPILEPATTVHKVLIPKATLGEWGDATKMKDLFKVSDTAEIMFTFGSPMPSLVSSSDDLPCSLAVARDDSSDVSNDDSSDEL